MTYTFTAVYAESEGWIVALVEELYGVHTQARTMAEARRNLREVIQADLEFNRRHHATPFGGCRIIERSVITVTVDWTRFPPRHSM
ncbi:MAG: type II toxin-antitoxin system HicB family antitoxin [Acidobacteriota bacterium]